MANFSDDSDRDALVGKQIIEEAIRLCGSHKKFEVEIAEKQVSDNEETLRVLYDVVIEDEDLFDSEYETQIRWYLRKGMAEQAEHYKQVIANETHAISETAFMMTAIEPFTKMHSFENKKPKVYKFAEVYSEGRINE